MFFERSSFEGSPCLYAENHLQTPWFPAFDPPQAWARGDLLYLTGLEDMLRRRWVEIQQRYYRGFAKFW